MKVLILNGPNLNLLGKREPEIYGKKTFEDFFDDLKKRFPNITLSYYQSNHEGNIIDKIQEVGFTYDGIVINAGAFTHYSYAISDAIKAVPAPTIEVHISNIHARESFRHKSTLTAVCVGMMTGFGLQGYDLALQYLSNEAS